MGHKIWVHGAGTNWSEFGTNASFYYILYKLAFLERWRMKLHINFAGTMVQAVFRKFYNIFIITIVWYIYMLWGFGELFIFSGFRLRTVVPDDVSYRFWLF